MFSVFHNLSIRLNMTQSLREFRSSLCRNRPEACWAARNPVVFGWSRPYIKIMGKKLPEHVCLSTTGFPNPNPPSWRERGKEWITWWADFSLHKAMHNLNFRSKSSLDTLAVIQNYVGFDRCGANHLQCRRRNTQYTLQESGAAKLEQGVDAV